MLSLSRDDQRTIRPEDKNQEKIDSKTTHPSSYSTPTTNLSFVHKALCHPTSPGSAVCSNVTVKPKATPDLTHFRSQEEIKQLRKENISLRRTLLSLQSELFGARLAAKYLDKELAGRIQQIQLLGKSDLKTDDYDRLWNQLEAEIHLHRHKTVVKACRGRSNIVAGVQTGLVTLPYPPEHDPQALKKKQGIGALRIIEVNRDETDGLGISVTGGKEHGIPVLISEVHPNTPASRTGALYVGDAILAVNGIDLRAFKHAEAAQILTEQVSLISSN